MANRSVPRGPSTPRTTERSRGVAASSASAEGRSGTPRGAGTSIELVSTFVPIAGMTCRSCEQRIERNVRRIPNVVQASASAVQARVEIISEGPVPAAAVAEAVEAAGYSVGGTPWLTHDLRTWITAGVGLLAIVAIALVAEMTGLLGLASGIGDIREGGLVVALLLGLAAGVSTCMALTGGLVLALSAAYTASRPAVAGASVAARMRPHFVFHAGRIAGFALLGAVLGAIGSSVALPTPLVATLMIAVAIVMTILGTRLTGLSPRIAAWSPTLPAGFSRALGLTEGSVSAYSDLRALALGAATFFLPCGFTQAVQVYALSTGSPLYAGAIMAVFAIGTAPGLLALGGLPALVPARSRPMLLQLVGVVVLGFAMVNAMAGLRLVGVTPSIGGGGSAGAPAPVVTIENGVQTLRTFQLANGYMPADAALYAGMPTRWIVESLDPNSCAIFLQVPSLGLNVTLAKGENAIDLPPLEPGRLTYMCSMGMYVGQLTVVDAPSGASTGSAGG